MPLQREAPIPVWGTTTPGAAVTVTLTKDTMAEAASSATAEHVSAYAGPDGLWHATLPALPAGGPYTLSAASSAGPRETVRDILIGDVFLCSGQSNMEYPTRLASDYDQDVTTRKTLRSVCFTSSAFPARCRAPLSAPMPIGT